MTTYFFTMLSDIIQRVEASETSWPSRRALVACASVCRLWREITKVLLRHLNNVVLLRSIRSRYPNLKSIKELIYKRGYGKVDRQRIPLTDNSIIDLDSLQSLNLLIDNLN
ncbi:hypothetical protein TSUD_03670 [Trifolium subterraneum]|nr:hypothetical protein TSUD_03670 [Trifolium subterraneum]